MSRFNELQKTFANLQKHVPADVQAELYVTESETLNVAHLDGKLDKYGFSQSHAASIRVIVLGCEGLASSEDLSETSLRTTFDQALANAKLLAESSPDLEFETSWPKLKLGR